MTNRPTMYILAGPNGSGKSSVLEQEIPQDIIKLNADNFSLEIAREKGIPENEIRYILNFSAKIAKEKGIPEDEIKDTISRSNILKLAGMERMSSFMQQTIEQGNSFSAETTLHVKAYQKYIKDAKSHGFEVELLYVGTENPEINKKRVDFRVSQGGHDIDPDTIESRYYGSLKRLSGYIGMVDKAIIYDNTAKPRIILSIEHGKIIEINKPVPKWVNNNVISI